MDDAPGRTLPARISLPGSRRAVSWACVRNPELACEVTLQPLRRYAMDAAILFSDILTIPDAMGLGLCCGGRGPRVRAAPAGRRGYRGLEPERAVSELGYVMDAVALIRRELKGEVPLIGFSGSPWTLATYMVEGGSSRTLPRSRHWPLTSRGDAFPVGETGGRGRSVPGCRVAHGAQALQIFDTWGGALSHAAYRVLTELHGPDY